MSEERPKYGEYATPEQQRAAIRQPLPEYQQPGFQQPAFDDAAATGRSQAGEPYGSQPAPGAHAGSGYGQPGYGQRGMGSPGVQRRAASGPNLIATVVLLVFGAFGALMTSTSWLRINDLLPDVFGQMGVPSDVAGIQRGAGTGLLIAAVTLVGYLLTLWWSWTWLRRGRSTWWIPLVGFAGTTLLTGIALAFVLANDPAFAWLLDHGMRM